MSIDVNVQNDLVIVTESSEDITVNVSNAAGPAGVGVPSGGSTGQVLKKLSNTNYDTYWALDGGGVPYSGATGDVNLGEFQLRAGQLTLDTSPTGTAAVGTTRWNDTIGSSETTLKGGSVILKNGVDLVARVVNKVTPNTTLTKAAYQAVRVSGAQGQRLAVALAQANNDANSADTIGLVTETIATNQEGFIMTVGQLENINTTGSLQGETWADGDVLYLSPTTAGAITKVKPTGNGHIVVIGYVEYAHANNGKIYVKVMNGWELDELHDVSIVSAANNEALIYESSTQLWKNKTIASALGYTPISGTGATGQVAYWNGTSSQTGSNNLFWDAANSKLGIGTNAPITRLHLSGDFGSEGAYIDRYTTQVAAAPVLVLRRSRGSVSVPSSVLSGDTLGVLGFRGYGATSFSDGSRAGLGVLTTENWTDSAQGTLLGLFTTANGATTATYKMQVFPTGNVVIQNGGTFTDGGQRLQVYGDAFIKGSGATSATNALLVQNSAGTELVRIDNSGQAFFSNRIAVNRIQVTSTANQLELAGGGVSASGGDGIALGQFTNVSNTSGIHNRVFSGGSFLPTSGTGVSNFLQVAGTINQTGGANGITRGLYVNPTLTAAADWRSIEWSNNSGWGLYGAGTANNFLNGNLGIASTPLAWPATFKVLQFSSGSLGSSTDQNNLVLAYNYFFNGTNTTYRTNGHASGYQQYLGQHVWYTAPNGTAGNVVTLTQQMTLTNAGRLLLGTTTEGTFLLDVNGTARVSGNLSIVGGSFLSSTLYYNGTYGLVVAGGTGSLSDVLLTDRSGAVRIQVVNGGNNFLTASAIGGVGIGTTSGVTRIYNDVTNGLSYVGNTSASTHSVSIFGDSGTNGLFIKNDGLIKIGASNSTYNSSAILEAVSTTKGFLPPRMTTTQKNAIGTPAAGLMVFDTTLNKLCVYTTAWETITSI